MQLGHWAKQIGLCLVVMAALAEVARADPFGKADLPQIVNPSTHDTTNFPSQQRTFLTTDSIAFEALYYDPNFFCSGVAPASADLLLFNSEGKLLSSFPISTSDTTQGTRYRRLFKSFPSVAAIPLSPGTYRYTFLVSDCTKTFQIVLPDSPTFTVFAP